MNLNKGDLCVKCGLREVFCFQSGECRRCYYKNYFKNYKKPISEENHSRRIHNNFLLKKMKYHYIFDMYQAGKTLEEIGKHVGVTRERIRQILRDYFDYSKRGEKK